jgi:cholesterol transport system auxiliary component
MMLQLDSPNRAAAALSAALLCAVLAGCSSTGGSTKQMFDLGLPASNAPPAVVNERLTIAVAPISASEWLDSNAIVYRLGYVDVQQPKRYANSQWTGVPAELLMRRLRNKLADQVNVVAEGDTVGAAVIKIELEEFDQVFDSAQDSHAVLKLRASLVRNGRLIAQRSFFAEHAATTPDATGGAHALAALSDETLAQVVQWTLSSLK